MHPPTSTLRLFLLNLKHRTSCVHDNTAVGLTNCLKSQMSMWEVCTCPDTVALWSNDIFLTADAANIPCVSGTQSMATILLNLLYCGSVDVVIEWSIYIRYICLEDEEG